MSIEIVAPIPLPRAAEVEPSAGKSTTTAEKDPKSFSDVMNGLEAESDAAKSDEAPQAKDADSVGDKKVAKKLPGKKTVADGAAPDATVLMAGFIPPAVPPADTVSTGVAEVPDAQGAEPVVLLASAGEGAAAIASDARSQALTADERTNPVSLANYASVFEQIQSRMAKGDAPSTGLAQSTQSVGEAGLKGAAKPVLGTAAADARADRLGSLGGGSFVLPVSEPTAMQAVTDATEALKLASVDAKAGESGRSVEGGHVPQHFTPTVQFESTSKAVDMSQGVPERAVADQVSYWISQGVQNAELTLNGFDSQPVEVRISLSGNEAHVAFRSDQAETREFLTGASGHLKDLLQSEGMVLSGMSVGSSGAENTGERERRAPSDGSQSSARKAREESTVRPVAHARVSGSAVDLFV
jgi:flagellar hook-length control protein FliK